MSLELLTIIKNARFELKRAIPLYESGELSGFKATHGIGAMYRELGTCRMLIEGIPEPLFLAQMQSASAYLFGLKKLGGDKKVTSLAACWWDSLAAGYWEAAEEIVRYSRVEFNSTWEHEDDFLYVAYLMSFVFPEAWNSIDEHQSILAEVNHIQTSYLQRWEQMLNGDSTPKLELCHSLEARDERKFQSSLEAVYESRQEWLDQKHKKDRLSDDDMRWVKPVWPEGLALFNIAQQIGINNVECPGVPDILKKSSSFRYNSSAWKQVDYQPQVR